MIHALTKLTADWRFDREEESLMAIRDVGARTVRVDLTGVEWIEKEGRIDTQLAAYLELLTLRRTHERIHQALRLPEKAGFGPHARRTFPFRCASEWQDAILKALRTIEDWAALVDEETTIRSFAASRPDRPSGAQINHLAALAYLGEFSVLEDYQRAFRGGRRLNFVPMISEPTITAALDLAYDQFAARTTK